MKKSLKYSIAAYGVAGLVLLTGCGDGTTDTAVDTTTTDRVVVEERAVEPGDTSADVPQESSESSEESVDASEQVSLDVPYDSPAGAHEFSAELTIEDGKVVAASATQEANLTHPAVIKWQGAFVENFEAAVVGKSLEELQDVDAIGGASLTTGGFKEAVAKL